MVAATPAPATLNWRSLAQSTNRTSRRMGRNVTKLVRRTVSFHVCHFVLDREAKAIKMTPWKRYSLTFLPANPSSPSRLFLKGFLSSYGALLQWPWNRMLLPEPLRYKNNVRVRRARHEGPRTPPRTNDANPDCVFVEKAFFCPLFTTPLVSSHSGLLNGVRPF